MYDLTLREQTERARSAIEEALGLFKGAQVAPPGQAPAPGPSPGEPPPPAAPSGPGAMGNPGQAQGAPNTPFQGAASNPALRQQQGEMGSLEAALGKPAVRAGGPLMPGFAKGGLVDDFKVKEPRP